jgi:5-methylcytosine-specific restriction protein A
MREENIDVCKNRRSARTERDRQEGDSLPGQVTGSKLNRKWGVKAQHALYREDGRWYHVLKHFPGALFDAHGYIVFQTEHEFRNSSYLSIGDEVNISHPNGISAIPGYVHVK